MLARVDRVVALVSWVAAAAVILMLLFGPALVAHDSSGPAAASPYGGGGSSSGSSAISGKQVFVGNCGSCHTFAPAGTSGQVGPDLDGLSLTVAQVAQQVRQGGGAMPSFAGSLTPAQIQAVATFVATGH